MTLFCTEYGPEFHTEFAFSLNQLFPNRAAVALEGHCKNVMRAGNLPSTPKATEQHVYMSDLFRTSTAAEHHKMLC